MTHTPKVALSDKVAYAMGWVVQQTPNGTIVWHNGGTSAFGSYFGMAPDKHVAVVVLTNEANVGFPDAIGLWVMDRLLGNPKVDHVANASKAARAAFERSVRQFAKPDNPRPVPAARAVCRNLHQSGYRQSHAVRSRAMHWLMGSRRQWREAKARLNGTATFSRPQPMPLGRFAAVAEDLGPLPYAFVQFQIDKDGRLNVLRLSFDDGQAYEFTRE